MFAKLKKQTPTAIRMVKEEGPPVLLAALLLVQLVWRSEGSEATHNEKLLWCNA